MNVQNLSVLPALTKISEVPASRAWSMESSFHILSKFFLCLNSCSKHCKVIRMAFNWRRSSSKANCWRHDDELSGPSKSQNGKCLSSCR